MGYKDLKFDKDSVFLVTGGAGFIGSNLCEAILNLGYKVRCLDDLSTGNPKHVEMFEGNPNYTFIKGDIKDLDTRNTLSLSNFKSLYPMDFLSFLPQPRHCILFMTIECSQSVHSIISDKRSADCAMIRKYFCPSAPDIRSNQLKEAILLPEI